MCSEKLMFVNLISRIRLHVIFKPANTDKHNLAFLYICSSGHRNSRLKKSNKMQLYAEKFNFCTLQYDLHQRLQLQFYVPDDGCDGRPKHVE